MTRNTLRDLKKNQELLKSEIELLSAMKDRAPEINKIINKELKELMQVTFNRIEHALNLRKALLFPKNSTERNKLIMQAKTIRSISLDSMDYLTNNFNRYPEIPLFQRHKNPTSYGWGYGWPAKNLHHWFRDEQMVRRNKFNPFYLNIYNFWRTLF